MHQKEKVTDNMDIRKNRVERLKKIILAVFMLFLIIPTILCIILFIKVNNLEKKIEQLSDLTQAVSHKEEVSYDKEAKMTVVDTDSYQINSATKEDVVVKVREKTAYLTFDDGPSEKTAEILDVLKQYQVKATFFVVGKEDKESLSLYKRIVNEGHTIGMHSYSHSYKEIYASLDSFSNDLSRIQTTILNATGVKSTLYRFPGGSSNKVSKVDMSELAQYLTEQGITYVDWNVSSGDTAKGGLQTDDIINNIFNNLNRYSKPVILLHDAKDKQVTLEALPQIILKLQQEDFDLQPIDQTMDLVKHLKIQ